MFCFSPPKCVKWGGFGQEGTFQNACSYKKGAQQTSFTSQEVSLTLQIRRPKQKSPINHVTRGTCECVRRAFFQYQKSGQDIGDVETLGEQWSWNVSPFPFNGCVLNEQKILKSATPLQQHETERSFCWFSKSFFLSFFSFFSSKFKLNFVWVRISLCRSEMKYCDWEDSHTCWLRRLSLSKWDNEEEGFANRKVGILFCVDSSTHKKDTDET